MGLGLQISGLWGFGSLGFVVLGQVFRALALGVLGWCCPECWALSLGFWALGLTSRGVGTASHSIY